ncbi:hypothetical protein Amn_pc00700 (plasmid) [Aminobacter sp. Y103A]|nr:hypothetical protein Amn_pc00700 [Aminobacter sp. SS-2016]
MSAGASKPRRTDTLTLQRVPKSSLSCGEKDASHLHDRTLNGARTTRLMNRTG